MRTQGGRSVLNTKLATFAVALPDCIEHSMVETTMAKYMFEVENRQMLDECVKGVAPTHGRPIEGCQAALTVNIHRANMVKMVKMFALVLPSANSDHQIGQLPHHPGTIFYTAI